MDWGGPATAGATCRAAATAARIPGVLGARLSGGGFGGSVVVLLHPRDVETTRHALASAYRKEFGCACDIRTIVPADGAHVVDEA